MYGGQQRRELHAEDRPAEHADERRQRDGHAVAPPGDRRRAAPARSPRARRPSSPDSSLSPDRVREPVRDPSLAHDSATSRARPHRGPCASRSRTVVSQGRSQPPRCSNVDSRPPVKPHTSRPATANAGPDGTRRMAHLEPVRRIGQRPRAAPARRWRSRRVDRVHGRPAAPSARPPASRRTRTAGCTGRAAARAAPRRRIQPGLLLGLAQRRRDGVGVVRRRRGRRGTRPARRARAGCRPARRAARRGRASASSPNRISTARAPVRRRRDGTGGSAIGRRPGRGCRRAAGAATSARGPAAGRGHREPLHARRPPRPRLANGVGGSTRTTLPSARTR